MKLRLSLVIFIISIEILNCFFVYYKIVSVKKYIVCEYLYRRGFD